ncbi:teichuronic acid biosynthesis glycosyltransferase TuaG [Lachnospiraceae bacterium]|nr:teichuronic acid biosynthesis glycosyltransferase TuaG [Lachnospiraceae bacterium]
MISVVVPVHNAGRFICDTIRSVISQEYQDWELILVNDHSADDSVEKIRFFIEDYEKQGQPEKIRLLDTGDGKGAANARNVGIDAARGRYIAFLDADDIWEPEKLRMQLEFQEKIGKAFTFTGYEFADEDGVGIDRIVRVPLSINYSQALKNTTIFTSTVMFDMNVLSKEQIHMPEVPSEDTATWWKVLKSGYSAWGLDRPLTLYRRSSGTLSSNKKVAIQRIWNLYRNVEHLSLVKSAWCFIFYAVHAVGRRI